MALKCCRGFLGPRGAAEKERVIVSVCFFTPGHCVLGQAMILTFNTRLGAVKCRSDGAEGGQCCASGPQPLTSLACVLVFYCCSCDPLDNIVRLAYLKRLG